MVKECEYNKFEKMLSRQRLNDIFEHIKEQEKLKPAGYKPIPATIYTKCK